MNKNHHHLMNVFKAAHTKRENAKNNLPRLTRQKIKVSE